VQIDRHLSELWKKEKGVPFVKHRVVKKSEKQDVQTINSTVLNTVGLR